MSTTTSQSSSGIPTSDESSTDVSHSDSYTTATYSASTVDPPSQLQIEVNHSGFSGISDPSASSTSQTFLASNVATNTTIAKSAFPTVMEESNSETGSSLNESNPPDLQLECDYDVNPTELYRVIENKQWEVLLQLFQSKPSEMKTQASTWVARREPNGKLRWCLLPVHAAVIFQSPACVVEKLLQECPLAAQAKDDQGMLPLHLALRTKTTCWETIKLLMTTYPQAVFVHDRKGRSPLECGIASASTAAAAEQANTTSNTGSNSGGFLIGALTPKSKRSLATTSAGQGEMTATQQMLVFSVMELYKEISIREQLQIAVNKSRQEFETRTGAIQDNHVATLTQLKKGWENQRNDLNRKVQGYRKELQNLKNDFDFQQELLEEKLKTEMDLVGRLSQVTTALESKSRMSPEEIAKVVAEDISSKESTDVKLREAQKETECVKKTNKNLMLMVEKLLDEQKAMKKSLAQLSVDTKAKNDERQHLRDKYFAVHEQSVEMAESYTKNWQERLERTSVEVSDKLDTLLSQTKEQSTPSGAKKSHSNFATHEDSYGEEKKVEDSEIVHARSMMSGGLPIDP